MASEVWYPQDVINILKAVASAGELQGPEYRKALHDVALAFGLSKRTISADSIAWRIAKAIAEDPVPAGFACGPG